MSPSAQSNTCADGDGGAPDRYQCVNQYKPQIYQMVAVGTEVTPCPPHRSLRAELPHKAPASGLYRDTSSSESRLTTSRAPLNSIHICFPTLCPANGKFNNAPLGYPPFLHLLRRTVFVRRFLRYYGGIRLLTSVDGRITVNPSLPRPTLFRRSTDETSQLLRKQLPNMLRVSDRAGSKQDSRFMPCCVLPSGQKDGIGIPDLPISRLNGWPVGVPCQRFATHLTMTSA